MTEFERGVRFVIEHEETYTIGSGHPVTQFGKSQLTMVPKPSGTLLDSSAGHRERRVQAILHLGTTNE